MADEITAIGIDFGTTNTVAAAADRAGVRVAEVDHPAGRTAYRTVLAFWQARLGGRLERRQESGPFAIDRFVAEPHDTRFLQSMKSFAASASFRDTAVYGKRFDFADLLAAFLTSHRAHLGAGIPAAPSRIVVGRPVVFVGARPDPALALERYGQGFDRAGYGEPVCVYEPVAAAYFFAERLVGDATVLVADFGGGTSDFSVVRFERGPRGLTARPLGAAGVGIAGDTFDARIVERVVAPQIGKGTEYRSFGKILPIPSHYFASFARWHELSLLKSPATVRELKELAAAAVDPEGLERFIEIVEEDLAYNLYRSVAAVKTRLSAEERAEFLFEDRSLTIRAEVTRADFETWIADDVARMSRAVDEALASAGLGPDGIGRVFLTGGTSYVPMVRRLFAERFGADKLESGNEFDSIAAGLALIGREDRLEDWIAPSP